MRAKKNMLLVDNNKGILLFFDEVIYFNEKNF